MTDQARAKGLERQTEDHHGTCPCSECEELAEILVDHDWHFDGIGGLLLDAKGNEVTRDAARRDGGIKTMPRTYFADFLRDDGSPITVEFGYSPGTETMYSPRFGADGGDPAQIEIVSVMPNTLEYERMCRRSLDLRRDIVLMTADERDELRELDETMSIAKARCALTDAETERVLDAIAQVHNWEPDDDSDFEF